MKKKLLLSLLAAMTATYSQAQTPTEAYRPAFHFTPEKNWTNDPNGLLYYEGEYHLFYQYNPFGDTWGHMSWGHAISKDLIHWEHLPLAIPEFDNPDGKSQTMIFSGSAVIDYGNKSQVCPPGTKDCMVAIYTGHVHAKGEELEQHQNLAYSTDKGRTWTQYAKNPVLTLGTPSFRDPNVFWYEPQKKWVMSVVKPDIHTAMFYESKDLKSWTKTGEFGKQGDVSKIWECPALMEVPIENEPGKKKWVLYISSGHQVEGFVGMQYFVGNYDGKTFTLDKDNPKPARAGWGNSIDYGKDYYAAIEFNNLPKSQTKPITLGWALNWTYAKEIPTSPFRGSMTFTPRISLKRTPEGLILIQKPYLALAKLKRTPLESVKTLTLTSNEKVFSKATGERLEIKAELLPEQAKEIGLKIYKSGDEETIIRYVDGKVQFDRRKSGKVDFNPTFASVEEAPVKLKNGAVKLHILVDASMVEVYINDGEAVITDHVFPTKKDGTVSLFTEGGKGSFKNVTVEKLD
ncbi:levanase [Siphonobacter sp. SORGH_AS_0500]|uniref:glycoside hydrolase family 32 protein n=1 Tax=Siphonobacter sp. SORGH_AS_0500 TaxID=1864824 RepID=UPI000CA813CA|nr:glycoside hydrolase family 32 protein [Siphonobacter sp. SORGH_AS_0500]PKK34972.1 levanase [Siphonobacter sp. SORGH_AS_0500]